MTTQDRTDLGMVREVEPELDSITKPRQKRSIRDATRVDTHYEAKYSALPQFQADFEIKGQLYKRTPKYHGSDDENPYHHLNALYNHCQTMKPIGTQVEEVIWKIFHLSLEGKALEWYNLLATYEKKAYASWENLRRSYLEKYFPESKALLLRKEITTVEQQKKESLMDYLDRFQDLLYRCPNH